MFRFLSRVVVVSVFALSLNFTVVASAQARMLHPASKVVTSTNGSCVEQAMEWLNGILGKRPKSQKSPKKMTANDGCGIDPLGKPRPCG